MVNHIIASHSLQIFKVRKTIKALQQFKKQLPFLAAEVIKELEFIASNDEHPDAYKRCKEVCNNEMFMYIHTGVYTYTYHHMNVCTVNKGLFQCSYYLYIP